MWITLGSLCLQLSGIPGSGCLFLASFSVSPPSGTPVMQILFHLIWSHRFLKLSSLFKIPFYVHCSVWVSSIALSSRSLIHSAASSYLLLIQSSVFFSSFIIFCDFCLVLIFSVSLLKISFCLSILFSLLSIL